MVPRSICITALVILPAAIALGGWLLADYSYRPGATGQAIVRLNDKEKIELFGNAEDYSREQQSLVLFYHPHCPCTQSAIRCLERIYHRMSRQPRLVAFVYCPVDSSASWMDTSLTRYIKTIADVKFIPDPGGEACRRYGVTTSGHLLLFDSQDRLAFSGGITPGRGHEGDSLSSVDLLQRCSEDAVSRPANSWPVYGCPMVNTTDAKP